jgi:hypothetical protein
MRAVEHVIAESICAALRLFDSVSSDLGSVHQECAKRCPLLQSVICFSARNHADELLSRAPNEAISPELRGQSKDEKAHLMDELARRVRIDSFACECGVRESVTIKGKANVTFEDYWSGRLWPDAVCYSFYPIDVHDVEGHGIDIRPLPEGVVPTIPRRAMLPHGSRNLIVAGRCISCDKQAQSALRVEASCMAMGQAAGAMAALSARRGMDPEELSMSEIRGLLEEHGAIVPE